MYFRILYPPVGGPIQRLMDDCNKIDHRAFHEMPRNRSSFSSVLDTLIETVNECYLLPMKERGGKNNVTLDYVQHHSRIRTALFRFEVELANHRAADP